MPFPPENQKTMKHQGSHAQTDSWCSLFSAGVDRANSCSSGSKARTPMRRNNETLNWSFQTSDSGSIQPLCQPRQVGASSNHKESQMTHFFANSKQSFPG
jgi:hypothetical protein